MAKRIDTDLSNSFFGKQSISATSESASTSSELRSFLTTHALRFRSDSYHIKRVRSGNERSYLDARRHSAVLAQLRKTISARLNAIHTSNSTSYLPFRDLSCPSKATTSAFEPDLSSAHPIVDSLQHLHKKLSKNTFSKSKRCCSGRYEDERASMNTHRTLHVYLDAIDNVQSEFRRARWVKARDNLIKMSTLPVLTFRSDQASPGRGLVSFSDRLLHAAHLEDLLDRVIAKQEYILSEARTNLLHPQSDLDSTDSLAIHSDLTYGQSLNSIN